MSSPVQPRTLKRVYLPPSRPVSRNMVVYIQPYVSMVTFESGYALGSIVPFYAEVIPVYDSIVVAHSVSGMRFYEQIISLGDVVEEISPGLFEGRARPLDDIVRAVDDTLGDAGLAPLDRLVIRGYAIALSGIIYSLLTGERIPGSLSSLVILARGAFTANVIELGVAGRVLLATKPLPVFVAEEQAVADPEKLRLLYLYSLTEQQRFIRDAQSRLTRALAILVEMKLRGMEELQRMVGVTVAASMAGGRAAKKLEEEARELGIEDISKLIGELMGGPGGPGGERRGGGGGGPGQGGERRGGGDGGGGGGNPSPGGPG